MVKSNLWAVQDIDTLTLSSASSTRTCAKNSALDKEMQGSDRGKWKDIGDSLETQVYLISTQVEYNWSNKGGTMTQKSWIFLTQKTIWRTGEGSRMLAINLVKCNLPEWEGISCGGFSRSTILSVQMKITVTHTANVSIVILSRKNIRHYVNNCMIL